MAFKQIIKCDVCGADVMVENDYLDTILVESLGSCERCGMYHYCYAYGHYVTVIESQEFHSHYNDSGEDQKVVNEKMSKAISIARAKLDRANVDNQKHPQIPINVDTNWLKFLN